jgi:hypothetical protein
MNQPPLERWEKIERASLLIVAALLILVPVIRVVFGYGTPVQLLWAPVGFWCVWQALFEDRLDGNTAPSVTERVIAGAWLWFRRIVLGTVALGFLCIAAYGTLHFKEGDLWVILIVAGLGCFALWVALFGAGRHQSMSDDLEEHLRRRRRYKWWV